MKAELIRLGVSDKESDEILKDTTENQELILKQLKFIAFLKAKKAYWPFESSTSMVKMQRVWELCGEPNE